VLAETSDGRWRPAITYIVDAMEPAPAAPDYVQRIVVPARAYGFPSWYCARIERFA
jgi:hypothetical protein